MTIDEAIKDIKDNIKPVVGGKSLGMAIEALERQRWIPVTERLPEEYGEYLVTYRYDGKQIFMDFIEYETSYEFDHEKNRFKGDWLFADDWQAVNSEVIAWMPLPEPYRKERKNDGKWERGERE